MNWKHCGSSEFCATERAMPKLGKPGILMPESIQLYQPPPERGESNKITIPSVADRNTVESSFNSTSGSRASLIRTSIGRRTGAVTCKDTRSVFDFQFGTKSLTKLVSREQ